jgi:hypothetical protein
MAFIKIDPQFEALIPTLRPDEYAQLEANILREGCRDSLRVWGRLLLDGHNRYKICKAHDIPFGTTPIDLADREAALLWIEENQLGRRNLADDQRAIIAGRVAKRRAALSNQERASAGGKAKNGKCSEDTLSPKQKSRVRETVAKEQKLPVRKVRAAQELDAAAEKAPEGSPIKELPAKVLGGEITLAQARHEIRKDDLVPKERGHFPQKPIEDDRPTELEMLANIIFRPHPDETEARKRLAEFAIMIPLEVAEMAYEASLKCYDENWRAVRAIKDAWSNVKGYYEEMEAEAEKARNYLAQHHPEQLGGPKAPGTGGADHAGYNDPQRHGALGEHGR